MMTSGVRKLALTLHVLASVSWLGAVAAFLALAIAGLTNADAQIVRSCYVAMEVTTRYVIVPLCFASLLTGLASSLGTTWGLFRHYWVVIKLTLTILATVVLLVHTRPIRYVSDVAAQGPLARHELRDVRTQLVADAGAAMVVLVVNTVLAVCKPRGLTRYGRRKQRQERAAA
jgi:ABC-type anion transport system duplicated permease subunit